MHIIFFDTPTLRDNLKPFTLTRPISEIRSGILTMAQKWTHRLSPHNQYSNFTEGYLQKKYPLQASGADHLLFINASVYPEEALQQAITQMEEGQALRQGELLIAVYTSADQLNEIGNQQHDRPYKEAFEALTSMLSHCQNVEYNPPIQQLTQPWHIFLQNAAQIKADYELITKNRQSAKLDDPHTILYGKKEDIFIEEGVSVRASVLNAETGPIYLGKNATVHENAVIKGPFAMLEGSHVNIGSKIREATTLGPHSKLGGEVKNVVIFGNSNKGHEGFLGNAVIGEWCNFGADTNASNLKNNYKPVKVWNYGTRRYEDSGELFCGLMMGDHSKCGINTMFNTGTVVGVSANVFGTGYPEKFIPSFSWGGVGESSIYRIEKALEVAQHVVQRRGLQLSEADTEILEYIYEHRQAEWKK
ncbi:UDP-N-acetylglucosamine diphosphorylase/glucosamine-1-phosphate N-acetyltransferase [Catalinimonas alkaloidigena]|uniref:putative sugar nucleotidyl transferase n=1 Tax=Catalinimonas alkaloidigena TaxID=1075417 RepID=UPI0024050670|nr:putative sugar nucleotidyl transferase [Catalinimonas alkaloidigena]MDF9799529.1 UDP-N-acetylglucosamine diphosphorylase/glucosamine-1-phosphate N-acetyltransferase [Catalinimonas alkaloidigena]